MIKVGTDCSGIDTPIIAMKRLGVDFNHVFSCEIDHHARHAVEHNFSPEIMYKDITTRDNKTAPYVDLYVCGFPCQPFSSVGLRGGFETSKVFFNALDYITTKLPMIFLLENVKNIKYHNKSKTFDTILQSLNSSGKYDIHHAVLNTLDFGLPQTRQRLYILGVKKSSNIDVSDVFPPKPSAKQAKPLSEFLKRLSKTKKSHLKFFQLPANRVRKLKLVEQTMLDVHNKCYSLDLGCSLKYINPKVEVCMCLKASRCDYYISGPKHSRKLTPRECLRLQGIKSKDFKIVCSNRQTYKQAGNCMSVNVLEAIFRGFVFLMVDVGLKTAAE